MRRRTFLALFPVGVVVAVWRRLSSLVRPVADEHVARTITAVADIMFPGDGLPSASALGLPDRVLKTLSANSELRGLIEQGVDFLDARATREGVADFIALDETRRQAAVDAAFASGNTEVQQFVLAVRFHLGTAYYREPAIKAAFAYTGPPQPDGFADFHERPA
jgi:hypothetical protein